jgi:hypothetical protein
VTSNWFLQEVVKFSNVGYTAYGSKLLARHGNIDSIRVSGCSTDSVI